jgi:hypothetical protein
LSIIKVHKEVADSPEYLEKEFGYKRKGYHQDVYWANPPYNTIPHHPFVERKEIKKEILLQSFEPKTTA